MLLPPCVDAPKGKLPAQGPAHGPVASASGPPPAFLQRLRRPPEDPLPPALPPRALPGGPRASGGTGAPGPAVHRSREGGWRREGGRRRLVRLRVRTRWRARSAGRRGTEGWRSHPVALGAGRRQPARAGPRHLVQLLAQRLRAGAAVHREAAGGGLRRAIAGPPRHRLVPARMRPPSDRVALVAGGGPAPPRPLRLPPPPRDP